VFQDARDEAALNQDLKRVEQKLKPKAAPARVPTNALAASKPRTAPAPAVKAEAGGDAPPEIKKLSYATPSAL